MVDHKDFDRRLVEMVPLSVVDAPHATPAVVEELRWLLRPRLRARVIFVATDFETLPAVDVVDNSLRRTDLHITMEQGLPMPSVTDDRPIRDRTEAPARTRRAARTILSSLRRALAPWAA